MKNVLLPTYQQYPITIKKGQGCFVFDTSGKQYLDFYGGHAVCILGHCPKKVVKAIKQQANKLIFYSNIVSTHPQQQLAELLVKPWGNNTYKVFFMNSGGEANEVAIQIARKKTGKKTIISFKNSFHGRNTVACGATGIEKYHHFTPNLDTHYTFAELNDMESVKKLLTEDTAGIILEPIQSIGGINMATPEFCKTLEELAKKHEIPLIVDEVQTGLGRTGNFYYSQKIGIEPHIITLAKGIASGLPISAVLVHTSVSDSIENGDFATTFGGGPLVCAAGVATMEIIQEPAFLKKVGKNSAYLKQKLTTIPSVASVFGEGFLLGFTLKNPMDNLVQKLLSNGLMIGTSIKKEVYRIIPPLTVSKKEIDQGLAIISATLTSSK